MTIVDSMPSPSPQRKTLFKKKGSPIMSPGNRRRKDVGDYWLGKTLGKGSSGCVKIGVHKMTGEKVAIKIIPKSHLADNQSVEKAVKREIAVMKLIKHPNIMSLLDVIDLSDSPNLYLILEYVQGGELFEYLVSRRKLAETEARKYFQQIIIGLDYCHRHLICHRDLKPENLLLDREKNIKIADFGMASLQPKGSLLETSCGSPHYASPEIVNGIPYDGSASDIWSCGIILYALLSGHLPFDDDNIRQLLNKVKVGKYKIPDHVSNDAKDLIQKILVINPNKRLTMKEVQSHPWFIVDPPPNPTTLPDPPTAAEIGRPVSHTSEVDDRILETLKVLWTELSTEKILEALLNSDYNMQKVTYVLLQRHANSYWQTERDDDIRSVASPAKRRRRPVTICAFPNGKEPLPGFKNMMSKLAQQDKSLSPSTQRRAPQPLARLTTSRTPERGIPVSPSPPPPPVPPKPNVVRMDHMYDPSSLNRQPWPPLLQSPAQTMGSPMVPKAGNLFTVHSPYSPQLQNSAYAQQHQHMNISHMLSPRLGHRREDSKLGRVMQLWPRNKVDPQSPFMFRPATSNRPPYFLDRKTVESSSLVWNDPAHLPVMDSPTRQTHRYSFNPPVQGKPSPHSTKRTSWLPGLFHFKQPKVCSLECEARDEREAIGKLSQVLQECMDGFITERQEPDGRIRRKGEMKLVNNTKSVFLKFKLEIHQLLAAQKRGVYRISFIQQQGDAMALAAAVRILDKTLQIYEQEAELVSAANGWSINRAVI
ncbi:kinase-like domain-containing protein [Sporodiniella umbellata]|nr:kinase-like domain-containing protein [Sporodiniella umbellata]